MAANGIPSRFTKPMAEWLEEHERELWRFGERVGDLLSIEKELAEATRGKLYEIRGEASWRMLDASIDAVIVDLASWALGFYEKDGGGFLRKLTGPDQQALGWKFRKGEGPQGVDQHWVDAASVARRQAFDRLFRLPHALPPSEQPPAPKDWPTDYEIRNLCANLHQRFQKLHDDRNEHRAHKYERKKPRTAPRLDLDDVRKYLEACQELLRDIRLLSSDSSFDAYGYKAKARDNDSFAQDMVDLVLFDSFTWILLFGAGTEGNHDTSYAEKRSAHYERLHAKHDAGGAPPGVAFNHVSTEVE